MMSGSGLSVNAPEFVPRSYMTAAQPPPYAQPYAAPVHQTPKDRLQEAISVLKKHPGRFDSTVGNLTETLNHAIIDEEHLLSVVEEIFTQSTSGMDFSYMGARICHYFSDHLTVHVQSGNFRQHLLKRCHAEHKKAEALAQISDPRLHGFSLFLGELVLKLHGEGRDIKVFSTAMVELLSTLLSHPSDVNLKCAVKVLKLTGAVLDGCASSTSSPQARGDTGSGKNDTPSPLDKVFKQIKEKLVTPNSATTRPVKRMLLSVIELRAEGWGHDENPTSANSATQQGASDQAAQQSYVTYSAPTNIPYDFEVDGGMYYDENGQPVTYEEPAYYATEYYTPAANMPQVMGGTGDWSPAVDYQGTNEYQDNTIYGYIYEDDQVQNAEYPPVQGYANNIDAAENIENNDEMDEDIRAEFEKFIIESGQDEDQS